MLEPRESDVPALFLVLVVFPLVAYFLLGIWSEAAKKKESISLLAQLAAEESHVVEAVATASVIPLVSTKKHGLHVCARCFAPSTTRCSRCKAVRYCSGKCQIIHWRQVHKQECHQLVNENSSSFSMDISSKDSMLNDNVESEMSWYYDKQAGVDKAPSDNLINPSLSSDGVATMAHSLVDGPELSKLERRGSGKQVSHRCNRDILRREDATIVDSYDENSRSWPANSTSTTMLYKNPSIKHKSRTRRSDISAEETSKAHNFNSFNVNAYGQASVGSKPQGNNYSQSQHRDMLEMRSNYGSSSSSYPEKCWVSVNDTEAELISKGGNLPNGESKIHDDIKDSNCSSEMTSRNQTVKAKDAFHFVGTKISKSPGSCMNVVGEQQSMDMVDEQPCPGKEKKVQDADEPKAIGTRDTSLAQGKDEAPRMGIKKMMGLKKSSKLTKVTPEHRHDEYNKKNMLFPYEEFVKLFQCEVFDLLPRGLLNCGNSCYANAVLQCLTSTKPLIIYLLQGSHSRACCGKDWCLICELEQHVMMLRESGGPLSPSRILLHMQCINSQIGDGSQEDAHEFLRLLIALMQSTCLDGLGGESKVDPRLQETTFIQHTFGGRLRSKVKCLICYHESERYENIMDLSLEIFGWVESLEDALTQFTTPEDLDGENMYRCGRCDAYVRARKQLSIDVAPNVLTIVLKRFQEGKYGKINKCITFPEFLDMIPFMTGTSDIPPLYLLYAVVVHLDTQNASFSGHYVSYVKDMRGSWFRIDDTEVHPVPVNQVMSEGAYILFYIRSSPRPQGVRTSGRHCTRKNGKPPRHGQSKRSSLLVGPELLSNSRPENATGILRSSNKNMQAVTERFAEPVIMEFSDATSSDWSLFTSSDEASFTTESTRDSFSTVDYGDACNVDPSYSIFNTVCCKTFSSSRPQTRFISEEKGYVLNSFLSRQYPIRVQREESLREVGDSSINSFPSSSNCDTFVNYCNLKHILDRTSSHCKL